MGVTIECNNEGSVYVAGSNNYSLQTTGNVKGFDARFNDNFTTAITDYSTISAVTDAITDMRADVVTELGDRIDTVEVSLSTPISDLDARTSSINNKFGSYVSKDSMGSIYSLELDTTASNGTKLITGFQTGIETNAAGTGSYFYINASNFAVFGQATVDTIDDGDKYKDGIVYEVERDPDTGDIIMDGDYYKALTDDNGDVKPLVISPMESGNRAVPALAIKAYGNLSDPDVNKRMYRYETEFNGKVVFSSIKDMPDFTTGVNLMPPAYSSFEYNDNRLPEIKAIRADVSLRKRADRISTDGIHSLRIATDEEDGYIYLAGDNTFNITVHPSKRYILSLTAHLEDTGEPKDTDNMQVRVMYDDGDMEPTTLKSETFSLPVGGDTTRAFVIFSTTDSIESLVVRIDNDAFNDSGTVKLYIDSVMIEEAPTATEPSSYRRPALTSDTAIEAINRSVTTIDGNVITTGSIDTLQLKAKSITADKLVVGGSGINVLKHPSYRFANLIAGSETTGGNAMYWQDSIYVAEDIKEVVAYHDPDWGSVIEGAGFRIDTEEEPSANTYVRFGGGRGSNYTTKVTKEKYILSAWVFTTSVKAQAIGMAIVYENDAGDAKKVKHSYTVPTKTWSQIHFVIDFKTISGGIKDNLCNINIYNDGYTDGDATASRVYIQGMMLESYTEGEDETPSMYKPYIPSEGIIESSNYKYNTGSPVGFHLNAGGDVNGYNIVGGSIYGGQIEGSYGNFTSDVPSTKHSVTIDGTTRNFNTTLVGSNTSTADSATPVGLLGYSKNSSGYGVAGLGELYGGVFYGDNAVGAYGDTIGIKASGSDTGIVAANSNIALHGVGSTTGVVGMRNGSYEAHKCGANVSSTDSDDNTNNHFGIWSQTKGGSGFGGVFRNYNSKAPTVTMQKEKGTHNLIEAAYRESSDDNYEQVFKVDYEGNVYHKGTSSSFTGSHDSYMSEDEDITTGDIVIDTGVVHKEKMYQGNGEVAYSTKEYCKAVFGIMLNELTNTNEDSLDTIQDTDKAPDGFINVSIMAVGEGYMNICDANGDITIGDFICSSDIKGKGMRQDGDLLHSYTVAKARESVVWDDEECDEIEGHKWKQVAVTYHCG